MRFEQQYKKNLRKIQNLLYRAQQHIHFKLYRLSLGGKIGLFGAAIVLFSGFQTWVYAPENMSGNKDVPIAGISGFSPLLGYTSVWLVCIALLVIFFLISFKKREKLTYIGVIRVQEYQVTLLSALLSMILSIHTFLFINGLRMFSYEITYGSGIIYACIGGLFLIISSYFLKKEQRKNVRGSYVNESYEQETGRFKAHQEDEDNMKLPF